MKAMKFVLIGLLVMGLVFVSACTTQSSGAPAPSGPIGGGCGVAPSAEVGAAAVVIGAESAVAL